MSQSPVIVGWKVVLLPRQQKEFDEKWKDKDIVSRLRRKRYIDSLVLSDTIASTQPKPKKKTK